MVDNSENILVDYDYNNIIVVDPNKVVDTNGNVKERYVKQENLVIYANLECNVLPRTKLAVGSSNTTDIKTVSIASINFLKPGNKEFMDIGYTNELTGLKKVNKNGTEQNNPNNLQQSAKNDDYYLNQSSNLNGDERASDNGLLGITSISIRQNTSFMSTITVELEDVRGKALFESGNSSPYAAFFNLPYPLFNLTIKGWYGKALKLPLMLQNFTSRYDGNSGNFKITLTFYTYKFTVLTEISMGAIQATPHMYKSNVTVQKLSGGPNATTPVQDVVYEQGYQKIRELYSEYKTKGLIPDDFPEITVTQLKNRVENFIKNVLDSFIKQNLNPLNNIQDYENEMITYKNKVYFGKSVIEPGWFEKYMDKDNYYVLKNSRVKIYTFKAFYNTLEKQTNAKNKLEQIIGDGNKSLNSNTTLGENGTYTINNVTKPSAIVCSININDFQKIIQDGDIDLTETYVQRNGGAIPTTEQLNELEKQLKTTLNSVGSINLSNGETNPKIPFYYFEGIGSFLDKTNQILKTVKIKKEEIQTSLTDALSEKLQSKNTGIGFVPTIRNVLAVIFANGEAFLRLMEDVHSKAWDLRNEKVRKSAILGTKPSSDNLNPGENENTPIYPWPQYIVETTGENGRGKYEIRYPGESEVIDQTKGFEFQYWPEVEFLEEFVRAFTETTQFKNQTPQDFSNEETDIKRISFNAIEFPVSNAVFSNKEEIKFFYEIFERLFFVTNYSRLSRMNFDTEFSDKITSLLADGEKNNLLVSLSDDNPFLIQKLQNYGINSSNFISILRHFSNDGEGQSWQNYIRGIFNTSYIKNLSQNSNFEFLNKNILNDSLSSPLISLTNEIDLIELVGNSTKSNVFDFLDIYPFTNLDWVKNNLAYGTSTLTVESSFDTRKILVFNTDKKIISNFSVNTSSLQKRPITNFLWGTNPTQPLISNTTNLSSFYDSRVPENQLITEGDVYYNNYSGFVTSTQTTSMFNTPFFVNAIQEGVSNFRNNDPYPYKAAAFLFLNSLPLATLREKYKTYENGATTDLDYIFATIKKFGAIHKVPYAWILKIGSIWSRYKTYVETGTDFLNTSWSNFNYISNYDPITNSPTKQYSLVVNGGAIDIILEKNTVIGTDTSSLIHSGFYPKLINDFNVFYQGFQIYSTYTNSDIQDGFSSGVTLNYVDSAIIDYANGFDENNTDRSLRIIPWSVTVKTLDDKFNYVIPSQGSSINQVKFECFSNGQIKQEVLGNQSMYNGSIRTYWSSPQYGYFDISKITKPSPEQYLKNILLTSKIQENFSFNGINSYYSDISEIFSVFEKDVLDRFENEFLNFSRSVYDYKSNIVSENDTDTEYSIKNFQFFMREMMKVPYSGGTNGTQTVGNTSDGQFIQINKFLIQFLEYDVVFKYGNPSNFDKRLFYTFSNLPIIEPYTWDSYRVSTPNALPVNGVSVSLSQSQTNYPDAWKTLKTYVGFSNIPDLVYSNNGSYITDFFIDLDVAFSSSNIKNFAPIIKIYATQKLNQNQTNEIVPEQAPPNISSPASPPLDGIEVAVANLQNGNIIIVQKESAFPYNPNFYPIAYNSDGQVLYTGEKEAPFPPTIWNDYCQQLINNTIIQLYGSLSTNPTDPQYIVNQDIHAIRNYPTIPNPLSNEGKKSFAESMTDYLLQSTSFQDKITNNLFTRLRLDLPKVTISNYRTLNSKLDGDLTKRDLWESFKATNDKWISGNDFKNKTLFEDVLFLDRASRDIGNKVIIDIYKLKERLTNINPKTNMLTYVQSIIQENHFVVMNVPSYMNFYNVQDATKNPVPKMEGVGDFANSLFGTFMNVDYRNSSSKLVCFYGGKPSEHLAVNNVDYKFKDDGFDLKKDNPLIENQVDKKDWDKSNRVVGFNIDIGTQNQQIFHGFSLSQDAGLSTAESIQILNDMTAQSGNRQAATQNISLYNLYKTRSYKCTINMMGNAMIQPTMYFNLRYVPMFSGPYMILSVDHTISQGSFETVLTGIRQTIYSLPQLDDYLQTLKVNLLQSIVETTLTQERQNATTAKTQSSGSILTDGTLIGSSNTQDNTQVSTAINEACKPTEKYSSYTPIDGPIKTEISYLDMYNTIISLTTNKTLQYLIFSSFYITSSKQANFSTYENNFAGITINQYWANTGDAYFSPDRKFYCSVNNKPYAKFSSIEKAIGFLISRWSGRIGTLTVTDKNLAEFWAINANRAEADVNKWNNLSQETKDILISDINEAITIFDAMELQ